MHAYARAAAATARGVARAAAATRTGGPRSMLLTGPAPARARTLSPLSSPVPLSVRRGAASQTTTTTAAAAATTTPATTATTTPLPTTTTTNPDWKIRMLYDGECALCMKEVDFLKKRASAYGEPIDFVDIASADYSPAANMGLSYEVSMSKIHALRPDGEVLTGIAVFRALYEAVGLGWVYSFTATPSVERAANAVYDFWARYRTQITGREDMNAIFEARRRRLALSQAGADLPASECRVDGSDCGVDDGGDVKK
jgi:predicted DCC family thiol-disulfide oxidoreductase YuxK